MLRPTLSLSLFLLLLQSHEGDTSAEVKTEVTVSKNTGKCSEGADKNCGQCTAGRCTVCWGMYPDSDGICQKPEKEIANCQTYLTSTTCSSCKSGYTLSNFTCVEITIPNCLIEINGKCTFCDGYSINGEGKCEKKCSDNCGICTVSESASICITCMAGFNLTTSLSDLFSSKLGSCEKGKGNLENCTSVFEKCITCLPEGYVVSKSGEDMRCEGGKFSMIFASVISGLLSVLLF